MPRRGSELPEQLLDAVGEALKETGPSALSLRDVARRAGVSHAAPAHHFKSKTGLLTAFAVQGFRRLGETVVDEIASCAPPDGPAVLGAVGRAYVRFALADPARFEVMFRVDALDLSSPDLVAATSAAFSLLVDTIERCREEGCLGGRDPMIVTVSAWSLVHGLASLWISGWLTDRTGMTDAESVAAGVSDLFVEAVLHGR